MNPGRLAGGLLVLCGGVLMATCAAAETAAESSAYLREHVYDTTVRGDEALALALGDPFPAVRREAQRALAALRRGG